MGRRDIHQGSIVASYGWDHMNGYFLSVVDKRLSWSENASAAVNAIVEKVSPDGGGCYFDLHTGPTGFGHAVDVATIARFWEAYGVPADYVRKAKNGEEF